MSISAQSIKNLQESNSPQAHGGGQGIPRLIINWQEKLNPASRIDGSFAPDNPGGAYVVSDFTGPICATRDAHLLLELIRLEATGLGLVRELVTGHVPEHREWKLLNADLRVDTTPGLSLQDLGLEDIAL